MNLECRLLGMLEIDENAKCGLLLPLTFNLDKNETYELESIKPEILEINKENYHLSNSIDYYPSDCIIDNSIKKTKSINKRYIHLQPESSSKETHSTTIVIKFNFLCSEKRIKNTESSISGRLTFSLLLKDRSPIRIFVDFDLNVMSNSINFQNPKNAENKYLLLVNLLNIVLQIAVVSLWNHTVNKKSYLPIINADIVNQIIIFLCGFLGLPILSFCKTIKLNKVRSFLLYPELYINPALAKCLNENTH